jgi:AAA15 family ATPase/GTPase
MSHKKLRDTMKNFFSGYSLKIVLKPAEMAFEVQKEEGDLIFNYPYQLTSDTLQRIIFYAIAIESNKDSTLIFEEPESHAFPYYTKWLGEKIGADTTNQYFIATHNPYLLQAVLEKTKKDDIQVFVTYYRNYQTKAIPLDPNQVSEIMTNDPFFNLDEFIPEEEG